MNSEDSDEEVAALELGLAQVDAAIGIGRGAEFELEDEILRELLLGPERLDTPALGGRGDDEASVDGTVAPVGALGLPVELLLGLDLDARVLHRLLGCRHRIDDEVIVATDLLGIHPLLGVEGAVGAVTAWNLAGDLAGQVGGIKAANTTAVGKMDQYRK